MPLLAPHVQAGADALPFRRSQEASLASFSLRLRRRPEGHPGSLTQDLSFARFFDPALPSVSPGHGRGAGLLVFAGIDPSPGSAARRSAIQGAGGGFFPDAATRQAGLVAQRAVPGGRGGKPKRAGAVGGIGPRESRSVQGRGRVPGRRRLPLCMGERPAHRVRRNRPRVRHQHTIGSRTTGSITCRVSSSRLMERRSSSQWMHTTRRPPTLQCWPSII